MPTMKVKPWGDGQGDFVVIDEQNFDPEFHEKFVEAKPKAPAKPKAARAE